MKIGVLALQGAVIEHLGTLEKCEVEGISVRTKEELDQVSGLIIPGGESTTVGKLMDRFGLDAPIIERAKAGMPLYGTCTGLILMSKEIVGSNQPKLGLMDISVIRNAFGRQVDSFEHDLYIPQIGEEPVRAVFIRAPVISRVGGGVEIMARVDDKIVMARQNNLLATSFHPELTEDTRVHKYFVEMVKSQTVIGV